METNEIVDLLMSENLIPVLPLRDVVVYPHMVIPLFVGREKSIEALDKAMLEDKQILLVAQKEAELDDPTFEELHSVGTLANILQLLKLPDGTVKVLVEGEQRSKVLRYQEQDGCIFAQVEEVAEISSLEDAQQDALVRAVMDSFSKYVKLNSKIPPEVLNALSGIEETGRLADTVAAHMSLKVAEKQALLEMPDIVQRLEKLMMLMENETDIFELEKTIRVRVKQQMDKNQREYYLNEQMKAIQKELGEMDDAVSEAEELEQKIAKAGMSKEAKEKAGVELNKLKMMSPMSAEASVVRNYIDWMLNVPWKKKTKVRHDLKLAEEILDADHYGLEKVKERILEYLAVQQRVKSLNGPILCLVGPPGVGKTSLGESIARATNRKYVRMALGGVRDEAEIRGHRRTYIGSMPGKILQSLSKIKVRNPLFLLDEIDKMAGDFRGDPASALLEVLDPEQNKAFADHYLEVDFDLSDVMFVATANTMNIPGPLLDRMEVIRLAGYTEDEKINIAIRYLLPKQLKNNGLSVSEVAIEEAVIQDIVRYYTREAGVRSLEREISKICRKVVKQLLLAEKSGKITIGSEQLESYLGVRRFSYGLAEEQDQVGQVTGLAWTEVGGELLTIEAVVMPGKGKQLSTGKLGDVMKESIEAAITVVRARADALGINADAFHKQDLHIHVPEGATPKDGPSAGVGMCTATISALTGIPVRADVAMTGEITLRGEVLAIGGLKEKLLAAHRGGIKTVIIPEENQKDLAEMPDNVKQNLTIKPVRWIDQVLEIALQYQPEPLINIATTAETNAQKAEEKTVRQH
ncbi:MAG: endopeptidase La [Methyloprofundus sp.]|nr:endopeptidase La [Methyloprofundus sp.]